jgi:hypothetical protein
VHGFLEALAKVRSITRRRLRVPTLRISWLRHLLREALAVARAELLSV